MNWEVFEEECTDYLNRTFGNSNINFQLQGGHDCTLADIKTFINKSYKFSIEIKQKSAQSGQFVLLDNGNELYYSPKNQSPVNEFSQLIIDYMNSKYDKYKGVSTNALEINLPCNIFESWIQNHYRNKNVKYIITNDGYNYVIFPLNKYGEYFRIHANFRVKGSGSSPLPKCDDVMVSDLINNTYGSHTILRKEKKAYCKTALNIPDKVQLHLKGRRYQLNKVQSGLYEIRKLSNTRNANVIFSIELIQPQNPIDLLNFKKELE